MAGKLEELRVYQQAQKFWESINAILQRPGYRRHRKLAEQTSDANDSITANIGEGFEQPTDAAFANYLFHAKGSLGEVLARLREARGKNLLTGAELTDRLQAGTSLSRSLGAFIRYLDTCGWKDRGRYKSRQRRQEANQASTGSTEMSGQHAHDRPSETEEPRRADPGRRTQAVRIQDVRPRD